MSWDERTWDAFCGLLEEAWPGDFDDATARSWRVLLDPVSPEQATVALRRLLLEGRRFRPSVSELLGAVRENPGRPTFEEALVLMRRAVSRADDTPGALACLADQPLVASFLERRGVPQFRVLPVDDPDWGEKTRRELREAWDRHVDAFDGREIAALAAGRPDGLRQFDPLASLAPARQLGERNATQREEQ